MKILIVAATSLEIQPFQDFLEKNPKGPGFFTWKIRDHQISTLVTGIGAVKTAFGLATYPGIGSFDILINAGVAGVYNKKFELGTVVEVVSDQFGDFGVEHQDKSFESMFDLGLERSDAFPFINQKILTQPSDFLSGLPKASSVSFNMVSGSRDTIALRSLFGADIESMEGASFSYAASCLQIPHIQIRSISNHVEPRDRSNWKMKEAVANLNMQLISLIENIIK